MDGNENETQDATASSAPEKQTGGDAPSATAPRDAGSVTSERTDGKSEDAETTAPPAKPRRRKRHTQPKADMDLLSDYQIIIEGLELAGEMLAPLLPAYGRRRDLHRGIPAPRRGAHREGQALGASS